MTILDPYRLQYQVDQDLLDQASAEGLGFWEFDIVVYDSPEYDSWFGVDSGVITTNSGIFDFDWEGTDVSGKTLYYDITRRISTSTSDDSVIFVRPKDTIMIYEP